MRLLCSSLEPNPGTVDRRWQVIIDDGAICPGVQFLPGVQLRPTVVALFQHTLEAQPGNHWARTSQS